MLVPPAMVVIGSVALFFVSAAAIFAAAFLGLRHAGRALDRRKSQTVRTRAAVIALACLLAAPAAAAIGFSGIGAMVYWAQINGASAPARMPSP